MQKQLLDRIFRAVGLYPADAWKLRVWYGQVLNGVDTDAIKRAKRAMRRYPEITAQQGIEPRIYD